jgi:uncharacterized protein (TIGR01777 family)
MKIAITGGSGFIGSKLSKKLAKDHEIIVLGRTPPKEKIKNVLFLQTNLIHDLPLQEYLSCDAVIHLAGANIFARWTKKYKQLIVESRIETTHSLINAIKKAGRGPKVFISASAIGYYGEGGESELIESSPNGSDFLAKVCKEWESVVKTAEEIGMRWVCMRTGIVLGAEGGMLKKLIPIFKWGVGGALGTGEQWLSWIAIEDLLHIYETILFDSYFIGPVNATSPQPVRNKEFAKSLGRWLHRPSFFSVPRFVLRIVLGELGDAILMSQKVIPQKLMNRNFPFTAVTLEQALEKSIQRPPSI